MASSRRNETKETVDELASREAACGALEAVLQKRLSVDAQYDRAVKILSESRDRAFVRMLVATVLRRLHQLDAVLDAFLTKRPPDPVLNVLRLGAAQLLFLETPAHAAVATAVALAKRHNERFGGLTNAVLRRVAEKGPEIVAGQDAARLTTPDWLWESWVGAYGEPVARVTAETHLTEPPLDLSAKDSAAASDWAKRLGGRLLPTGTIRCQATGRVQDMNGFDEGAWWVQDAAAALPARVLLHVLGDAVGKRVIDLCAAPGGKTAQLAAAGCEVTAVDADDGRLHRLRENLARLRLNAEVVVGDATTWRPENLAQAVLLDAPCSATGTIRRHPDLPHLKRPADIPVLASTQKKLLAAAVEMVEPGGYILYSVCSLQPEERRQVIESVLGADGRLEWVKIPKEAVGGEPQFVSPRGELRTMPPQWPEHGGLDGFYGALLRRRPEI
ncbi:MAG: RsmB/NOP family class I SAM-dependent RNA methyltransferase [Rhodospirillaceae bacterium]